MPSTVRLVVRRTADSVATEEILTAAGIVALAVLLRALLA
jgi:hypothetical protein